MISKTNTNHYLGRQIELINFRQAVLGDSFYTTDTNKFYVYYNNVWNLVSSDLSSNCIDGGSASSVPPCNS